MAAQVHPSHLPDGPVEAAIARVLDAETKARAAIARARDEAKQSDENARAAGRALAARTEARINAVRAALTLQADAEVAELDREANALTAEPALTNEDLARLERALSALAAQLIGTPR